MNGKKLMRPKLLYGYMDSFFIRSAVQTVNELFNRDINLLPIILKMLLHDVVMTALRKADLLSGAVFRGGACLQRIYGWSRFGEDLDFANFVELNDSHFIDVSRKFGSVIRTELKRLGFVDEQIMIKEPENPEWPGEARLAVKKWEMRVDVGPRNMNQFVKIELVDMPGYQYSSKAFVPLSNIFSSGPIMLNVESLNEIFNDKVISLIQGPNLKNGDIYDVGLLSDFQSIDKSLFLSKMADRNFTVDYVKERIDGLRQSIESGEQIKNFSAEMSRFVIPGKTPDVENPAVAQSILAKSLDVLESISHILDQPPSL